MRVIFVQVVETIKSNRTPLFSPTHTNKSTPARECARVQLSLKLICKWLRALACDDWFMHHQTGNLIRYICAPFPFVCCCVSEPPRLCVLCKWYVCHNKTRPRRGVGGWSTYTFSNAIIIIHLRWHSRCVGKSRYWVTAYTAGNNCDRQLATHWLALLRHRRAQYWISFHRTQPHKWYL